MKKYQRETENIYSLWACPHQLLFTCKRQRLKFCQEQPRRHRLVWLMKVDAAHGEANCHHVPRDVMVKKDTAHASVVLLQSTSLFINTSYQINPNSTMASRLQNIFMMEMIYWCWCGNWRRLYIIYRPYYNIVRTFISFSFVFWDRVTCSNQPDFELAT